MKSIELNIHLYQKALKLIKTLPQKEVEQLIIALKKRIPPKRKRKPNTDIQNLILNAPTWSDQEYKDYLDGKKHLNNFRSK
jgi:hypothetical protein